jgi:hypothetical protein
MSEARGRVALAITYFASRLPQLISNVRCRTFSTSRYMNKQSIVAVAQYFSSGSSREAGVRA